MFPFASNILIPLYSGGLWLAEIIMPLLNLSFLIKNGIAGVGQIPKSTTSFFVALIPLVKASSSIGPLTLVSLPINICPSSFVNFPHAYPILYAKE